MVVRSRKKEFWPIVNSVIKESDLLLMVMDARFYDKTLNKEIEHKVKDAGKVLIYILNKSDLLREKFQDLKLPFEHYIFVSSKENLGTTQLRNLIKRFAKKKPFYVGVLGYPNTGKSTLINALGQRKATATSSSPGFTKGRQLVRLSPGLFLLDTPGVIPYRDRKDLEKGFINVEDINKVKNPDVLAFRVLSYLLREDPERLKKVYGVEIVNNKVEMFEKIGKRLNILKKGAEIDEDKVARRIVRDWQRGIL